MLKGSHHSEATHAKMRASHPKKWSGRRRIAYETNPRFASAVQNQRKAKTAAVYRANHKDLLTLRKTTIKVEVLTHYGRGGTLCCVWEGCDVRDPDMLTLDHINNDGAKDRKTHRGRGKGHGLYCRVRNAKYPDGFQTLCANHQMKKEMLRIRG